MADCGTSTMQVLRSAVGTRARRRLLAVTLLVGLTTGPEARTLVALVGPAQLLMSVGTPSLGVLLARDLRLDPGRRQVLPTLLAAFLVAVGVALLGVLACVATVVLPLGLWAVLGAADATARAAVADPVPHERGLLAGDMTAPAWVRWLVVVLLWGVALNVLAALRTRAGRRAP